MANMLSPLATPAATRDVLEEHGLSTKHALGQNFLVNDAILQKIVELAQLDASDDVLEVGPGIGTLTIALLKCAGRVVSVERDADLPAVLKDTLEPWADRFSLISKDALELTEEEVHLALAKCAVSNEGAPRAQEGHEEHGEHGGHTPCSDSPRCAAELRAEHAPHAQELQAGAEGGSTCETASARGQHTPCSDSPRFAAELRAEHAVPAQKLQASSSIDAHRTPMSQVEGTLPMRQFSYRGREYATRLLGSYQPSNAAMAIEIAGALRERGWEIPDEAIARGIAETRWPARFEVLDQPAGMPTVVIDGGHNPQGAGVLADSLRDVFPDKRPVFLVGILADKDYRSMLRAVAPLASAFVCVTPPNPRALDAVDLAETIRETCGELGARATIEVAGDFDDAASAARKIAGPEGLICAFGSLYSIADVKAAFLRAADSNSLQP